MPGSLLVYNLPWLPRAHSITSTLLSLEAEAFQVTLFLLLVTHLTLARVESALRFSPSASWFTGISPPGSPSLPSAIVETLLILQEPSFNALPP